ncbi:MAG: hypothetical protein P8L85_20015 [Rubripirellula sp.]|nr:hypothetical protein [Rubripirellula sp.]
MDADSDNSSREEQEMPQIPPGIILEISEKFRPLHTDISSSWRSTLMEFQQSFRDCDHGQEKLKCVLTHSVVPEWPKRPDGPCPPEVEGMEPIAMGVGPSRWPQQLFTRSQAGREMGVAELASALPQSYRLKTLDVASKVELGGVMYTPAVGHDAIHNVTGNPILFSNGQPVALRTGVNRNYFVHAGGAAHERITNITSFFSLAAQAGQCLESLPTSVSRHLWRDWPDGFRTIGDKGMWVSALFELAWQQSAESQLTADRFTWIGTTNTRFDLSPSASQQSTSSNPADASTLAPVGPPHWYSVIDDLVSASIAAIEILLAVEDTKDCE